MHIKPPTTILRQVYRGEPAQFVRKGFFAMTVRTTVLLATIVPVSFLMITATSFAVLAQSHIKACAADVKARCKGTLPGEGRIACIKIHFNEFSLPCQLALVKQRAVRKACKADYEKICANIEAGGGRIEACMKDHFADLSDKCKETISQAGGKG